MILQLVSKSIRSNAGQQPVVLFFKWINTTFIYRFHFIPVHNVFKQYKFDTSPDLLVISPGFLALATLYTYYTVHGVRSPLLTRYGYHARPGLTGTIPTLLSDGVRVCVRAGAWVIINTAVLFALSVATLETQVVKSLYLNLNLLYMYDCG